MSEHRGKRIIDLPMELQRSIFKHSASSDLIALALVSKHFHAIACAQLYRTFSIVFPDEDDPSFDSPIDGLAGGLDTLVTSDHARHLREITLDSLSGADRGERAYRHYSYEVSCGKFMNTLLALALRQAKALETFHWNIRVELSRPLFRLLHDISSLRHLHVRLQEGPSLYQAPPPLPLSSDVSASPLQPHPPALTSTSVPITSPPLNHLGSTHAPTDLQLRVSPQKKRSSEPPTFSQFQRLESFAVLDMDTLDYVPEISSCIDRSSSSLKRLKLSLSDRLAMKSRKPVVEDSDDSDQDMDEFGNSVPQPLNSVSQNGLPEGTQEKEARMRGERKTQEAILSRVFGLEKAKAPASGAPSSDLDRAVSNEKASKGTSARKQLIGSLTTATQDFLNATKGIDWLGQDLEREALKLAQSIVSATRQTRGESQGEKKSSAEENSSEVIQDPTLNSSEKEREKEEMPGSSSEEGRTLEAEKDANNPGLFDHADSNSKGPVSRSTELNVDWIDIDHPDDVDDDVQDDKEEIQQLTSAIEGINVRGARRLSSPVDTTRTTTGDQSCPDTETNQSPRKDDATHQGPHGSAGPATLPVVPGVEGDSTSGNQAIRDYVRSTRKVALECLSLYLIPVKASTLSRAVDLTSLRRITLLNVGPQAPLWNLLLKENKTSPLMLRSIYTDNVTPSFLALVNSLEGLTDLLMLERSAKSKVENLAGKTTLDIGPIRKLALKKHMKTLKRLMIKNENDYSWDVDAKTMKLVTKKGADLAELAISMGLRSFHLLLQYLPGLANLKALYIVNFRTDDTCTWVMRELRKFAIDNVAHHAHLKLEYIALDGTVERLDRRIVTTKTEKSEHQQGEHEQPKDVQLVADDLSSGEDEDTDDGNSQAGLKIETREGLRFYDAYGIRVFRKDVRAGRL
ncbi:MAG: hypothetical protein M1833_002768 [Piccolia ochrophora]|nr:MAG: hypothetical protein M1833_002768 [Piccolia ochrophora]